MIATTTAKNRIPNGSRNGANTHRHDQATTPVSLKTIKTAVKAAEIKVSHKPTVLAIVGLVSIMVY